MSAPAFLATPPARAFLRYWSAKRLALLVGFVLTVVGSLGSQLLVAPQESLSNALDLSAKDLAARIDMFKSAQAQYVLFQQQGALIYALSAAGVSNGAPQGPQMISQLYQLNLLDRSQAVQTIIGGLAIDRQLNYRAVYDRYKALIDAARKDMSIAAYAAVDDAEKSLSGQATAEIGRLQGALTGANRAKAGADAAADRRRLLLLVAMTLGSTFLLAANLIATRQSAPPALSPAPAGGEAAASADDRVSELSTAAYLIEVALDRARAMGARGPGG